MVIFMILIETEKDYHGMWNFTISAGEKGSLDVVAQKIADELGKTKEEVICQTYENAARLFEIE